MITDHTYAETARADELGRELPRGESEARTAAGWRLLTASLVAADLLALGAAYALAYALRFEVGVPFLATPGDGVGRYVQVALWAIPVWLALFALCDLYDASYLTGGFHQYSRVATACSMGVLAIMAMSFLNTDLFISRGWLLSLWVLAILAVDSERFAARRILRWLRARGMLTTPMLIVGANEEGRALAEQFLSDRSSGARIAGFLDASLPCGTPVVGDCTVLGGLQDLERVIGEQRVRELVVATTALNRAQLLDLYWTVGHGRNVQIRLSSGLFEILTTGVRVQEISCVPLMTPERVRITGVDAALKAMLDYVVAALGLIAISPLFLGIALLIRLDSRGPVLHRRRVLGRSGKRFHAFKFRTMVVNADDVLARDQHLRQAFERGQKLREDPRVTRVGRLLRRSSLDELPQLINVLRGQMSLVGPRMIAPEEAARYGKWQLNLLTVKPGITGPWQVHGRCEIPYEERVRLSMQYIRSHSLWLDVEILLRTIGFVLQGKGAY